jgi:hypothetical protein
VLREAARKLKAAKAAEVAGIVLARQARCGSANIPRAMDDELRRMMLDEQGLARMAKALGISVEHAQELVEAFDIGPAAFENLDKHARQLLGKPLTACSGEDWRALDADVYRDLLAAHGLDEDKLGGELDRFLESLLGRDDE